MLIDSHTSVSDHAIVVATEIPLRISIIELYIYSPFFILNHDKISLSLLTKLDSSGDAKLNNKTLTSTIKVSMFLRI
jgi:hypothetical protein